MAYKQTKRKGKTGDVIIVDYGQLWKNQLLRCLGIQKLTVPETAKILKCTPWVVCYQKKKAGIHRKNEYTSVTRRYDPEIGPENYFKAQVLKLCEQHDEVTISILRKNIPGAYHYFKNHDFSWLRERIVYERNLAIERKCDEELLVKVKKAVKTIRKGGDAERRLTIGYIAGIAKVREAELKNANSKRPLTRAFLDSVLESRAEWLRKRITMIYQNKKVAGTPLSIDDIVYELGIKQQTYIRNENLIKEVINELNSKNE